MKPRGRHAPTLIKNQCLVCGKELSSNHSVYCRKHYNPGNSKVRDEDIDSRPKIPVDSKCPSCGCPVYWINGVTSRLPELARSGFFECRNGKCMWCEIMPRGYVYKGG